jgi:polyisoprenoid-binding protein YceI
MKRLLISLILAATTMPGLALGATWNIDPTHSDVGFKVRHFFSKVNGEFTDFSGTISFDPEKPEAASVEVTIQTASIDTDNERRDGHLKSEDFFFAETHPEITFKSTRVTSTESGLRVEGLLTMRGIEKPVVLDAEFLGAGPDGGGGTRAGFTATTEIDRKEWDINWNKALDQGGAVLGDEVAIILDIEAVLAQEESGE